MMPPKPPARPDKVSLWRYMRLFREDILSAQPERLYRAWMAEFRTPFFRSFMVNDTALIRRVLKERPMEFPKSDRIGEGLRPLLGQSVFLTNGDTWLRQRRLIDPAFEGGRLRDTFPAMLAAAQNAVDRITEGVHDIEPEASHVTADVIFRTLFSIPIEDRIARAVFEEFRIYQRTQPILNLAAFIPLPRWMPRLHRRATKRSARRIRALIEELVSQRQSAIAEGTAPDDLATKILLARDPETGERFEAGEMVDQVAIFFLAGHETSAAALGWTLYLLATHPDVQEKVAKEARDFMADPDFRKLSRMPHTRDVFRESLRLYPPVPMLVRETTQAEDMRGRTSGIGDQIVISPWHLHRQTRLWDNPDAFDPDRWQTENGRARMRDAYLPFSTGPRVCTGAGFAMAEGVVLLAAILASWRVAPVDGRIPMPQAHLTVRSADGIWLNFEPRSESYTIE
ncbi:cytochrome P450 [Palleronia caenipelagi]|uniref:Cytochrome P450 n=1 Tax=Palleronia caenipelagi TaxID=2489174 RepID=A0A547PMR0_9RHOB|nr:cytochrome P450 [Palleronia caenipelagi]TRD15304.1 cytochrome P450 [Palleronia caenipelagi]